MDFANLALGCSIKCHVCSRTRSVSFYSNRQILKHQNTVYNRKSTQVANLSMADLIAYIPGGRSFKDYATCKDCTAAQVDIIHCFVCDLDKSIDSFFFNQRSQAKPVRFDLVELACLGYLVDWL